MSEHEGEHNLELSVVIPCLNEAETLGTCISKANSAIAEHGIHGEVVVADNGSTDGSIEIAEEMGARVVRVTERGYGNALMGGIESARGKFVIMGDADDSYDFLQVPIFVKKLREGYDLVQGCRLPGGGGTVLPGAMPVTHRWIGNPLFSCLVRRMFRAPIHDVYCGLRGFTKRLYDDLDLRCTGMEFATEMIIKSALFEKKIAEVPITLHPDGRTEQTPHLRTIRDGWRTLRFFLMYSPRWLFLIPGLLLVVVGLVVFGLAMSQATVFGATLGAHTMLFASLAILMGYQSLQFAVFTKTFAISEGLSPMDRKMQFLFSLINLERGILVGAIVFVIGIVLLGSSVNEWRSVDFGRLDYASTMRLVIPGVTLAALGFQTVLCSFFVSILGMARR